MINWLINSTLCSGILLLAYQLLLKNKALFQFNRVYLLLSVFFSLSIPLIVIHRDIAPVPSFAPAQLLLSSNAGPVEGNQTTAIAAPIALRPANSGSDAIIAVYLLVTLLFLFRLFKNLHIINTAVKNCEKLYSNGVWLVLTDTRLVPHTFLNTIFLNRQEYYDGTVEKDVICHEMAHARQFHSIDVIFIELVQAICWFNPFVFLYRRAIQLNHEFIADAVAIHHSGNAYTYKTLLLSKASQLSSLNITSQFNYSITKKRLIMMTKHTSTAAAWFTRLAIIPVAAAAFMLFCNKTEAQQPAAAKTDSAAKKTKPEGIRKMRFAAPLAFGGHPYPTTKEGISKSEMDDYISYEKKYVTDNPDHMIKVTEDDKKHLVQLYQRMSLRQQADREISFTYPADPIGKSYVTRAQLDRYKNAQKYGVWIDDKRVKNELLQNADPTDFCVMSFSRLTPVAIKNDHFLFQVNLMTKRYYQKYLADANANRNTSMMMFRKKSGRTFVKS